MKKIIALVLTVVMIAAVIPLSAFAGRFTDVEDGKWYTEGINFCAANGYMNGVSETTFDRKGNVTRSMFVVILAAIDGVDLTPYESYSKFSDVAVGKWYTGAINWAAENNITAGIGDGVFGYKNPITREQIVLFFYTYANLKNIDTSARGDVSVFSDAGRTHAWAEEAMKWALAEGLISGIGDNLLDPRGYCTRAQAAVMIRTFVIKTVSDCEHDWVDATCTEGGYCKNCDLKTSDALGHDTDNGICSRCDAEVFATAHDKLIYYIGIVDVPGFSSEEAIDGSKFTTTVTADPVNYEVHIATRVTDAATGATNIVDVVLSNSTDTVHLLSAIIGDSVILGEFEAKLLDGYGDFTVTKYEGSEEDYPLALVSANYLLAYTVKHANDLIVEKAGMSLNDYGFVMDGFKIVE
ncbi:MAG: S-layer homology domain-containing protein [Clostridia bacterium]|nr:S-layer homology domain-containing protein [Clostridia bacterium]